MDKTIGTENVFRKEIGKKGKLACDWRKTAKEKKKVWNIDIEKPVLDSQTLLSRLSYIISKRRDWIPLKFCIILRLPNILSAPQQEKDQEDGWF